MVQGIVGVDISIGLNSLEYTPLDISLKEEQAVATIQRIKEEISKVVVGQDKMIEGLLYMMDMSRVSLPLNLQVYPLFVMRDRFVQGVISKGLLRGLIAESNHGATKSTISLEELQKRVEKV